MGRSSLNSGSWSRGFTLVELMVALVILLFVSMVTVFISASVFQANTKSIQMIQLTQEMRSAVQLIARDIRRSGYNDDALAGFLSTEAIASGVAMGDLDANGAAECIRVNYEDLDGNARSAVYRHRILAGVGRVSASFDANTTCDTATDDNAWVDVSDPVLTNISNLRFVLNDQLTDIAENQDTGNMVQVGVEMVNIVISANLRSDTSVNRSIISEVQLRNQFLTT